MLAGLSHWDVVKWLTAPPYPYALSDAVWYIENGQEKSWAITLDGAYIGSIGDLPELGYWLSADHHGAGLMTESAVLVVNWYFEQSDTPLLSGHFVGNGASRAVLRKLGFVDTRTDRQYSKPLGKEVTHQNMTLTQDRWHGLRNTAR